MNVMRMLGAALAAATLAAMTPSPAKADLTFELIGVNLSLQGYSIPAGSLTGTFTTNDTRTQILSALITAPMFQGPTHTFPGLTYSFDRANPSAGNSTIYDAQMPNNFRLSSGGNELQFAFSSPLSPNANVSTNFFLNGSSYEHEPEGGNRLVAAGSVKLAAAPTAAVPEPSTFAVFGAGMVFSLGALSRRNRRAAV